MTLVVAVLLCFVTQASAQRVSKLPDVRNMVLAGYQGWFGTPNDNGLGHWMHWGPSVPSPGRVSFELYPDVSEYPQDSLEPTRLGPLGNGQLSKLFSSFHEGVVDTHFRWMKEYNIDGIVSGRFMVATYDGRELAARNRMLQLIKKYSRKYSRFFYVSYDLTNARIPTLYQDLTEDWSRELEGKLQITEALHYVRGRGKPVVMLWGLDSDQMNQDLALELINYFKSQGMYVIGGVRWGWRDNITWHPVYKELNMIQPWTVAAYVTDDDVANFGREIFKADKNLAERWEVDYQNVLFPGFAWSNWGGGPRNVYPRRAGDFMWRQAYWIAPVTQGALVAMFDEYDEATAIAKSAETSQDIPQNQYFLTLDADGTPVSSDFYLRLTGEINRMLRRQRSRVYDVPIRLK